MHRMARPAPKAGKRRRPSNSKASGRAAKKSSRGRPASGSSSAARSKNRDAKKGGVKKQVQVQETVAEKAVRMLANMFLITGQEGDLKALSRVFANDPTNPKVSEDAEMLGNADCERDLNEYSYPDENHAGSGDAAKDARVAMAYIVNALRRQRYVSHTCNPAYCCTHM